ncbi:MAG: hypothetical protein RJA34_2525, partial [Pseudomonadota bacterium]
MNFDKLKIRTRFLILLGLFIMGFGVYGAWSLKTVNEVKVNGPLYQSIVQSKDLIADILPPPEYVIESYLVSLQLQASKDEAQQNALIERLKVLKGEYDTRHDYWAKQGLEEPLAGLLLNQAHQPAVAFYKTAFDELVPGVRSGNASAIQAAMDKATAQYQTHREAIDKVVGLSMKRAESSETLASDRIATSNMLLIAILVGSVVVCVIVALAITRSIVVPLQRSVSIAQTVAAGDLTSKFSVEGNSELSQLLNALKDMQTSLV